MEKILKRFTETTIWKQQWYRELSCKYKEMWRYLCENCDNAGIWDKDMPLAAFQINDSIDENDFLATINKDKKRIKVVNSGDRWLILDFFKFQIGNIKGNTGLQKNSRLLLKNYLHRGIISKEDYSILTGNLPVNHPSKTGIGKGKGKGKDNSKDIKERAIIISSNQVKDKTTIPPSLEEVSTYCTERKNGINPAIFIDFYQARGWLIGKNKMKDWRAAIRTWEQRRQEDGRSTRNTHQHTRESEKPTRGKFKDIGTEM